MLIFELEMGIFVNFSFWVLIDQKRVLEYLGCGENENILIKTLILEKKKKHLKGIVACGEAEEW